MRLSRTTRGAVLLAGAVAALTEGCTESSQESSLDSAGSTTETGSAVLLVEQRVHLGLATAERAYVLGHGTLAFAPFAAELRDDRSLLQASYLCDGSGGVATDRRSP